MMKIDRSPPSVRLSGMTIPYHIKYRRVIILGFGRGSITIDPNEARELAAELMAVANQAETMIREHYTKEKE